MNPLSLIDRFWAKTRVATDCPCHLCTSTDDQAAKCIVWTASDNGHGYGSFWTGTRVTKAHRFAYELRTGPIPDGLQIDHLCRVRRCVNPAHLELVTSAENTRRATAVKTHCANGHEFTPENTYHTPGTSEFPNGSRACRICRRIANRRSYARCRGRESDA